MLNWVSGYLNILSSTSAVFTLWIFKNVPGMKAVVKKTKAIGKYTHKSTEANKALKREAKKENINFRKFVIPPNTRWSGYHDNLASVLYLKK